MSMNRSDANILGQNNLTPLAGAAPEITQNKEETKE
jgi:hypothetical protein